MMKYNIEKIWDEFSLDLRAFILRRVKNASDVDDILQDVFLKIHANIDTLKEDEKVRSWIYQITRNTIIDYYRKHKNWTVDIDEIPVEAEMSESNMEEMIVGTPNQEIAADLKGMIDELPTKYSEALYLVEFEGLTQIELANRLGISISGAKSRVQRGRKLLLDSLMQCCHFELDRYGTIVDFHPHCCCCPNEK
jgi:RNA polymerase sigma-70 factor (ECF subfamily)